MPLRPAASRTAKARYGFVAESTARYSTRVELPLPVLYNGTRTSAERLLCPQQTNDGASAPPHSRLEEFTYCFVMAVISAAWCSSPAMNRRPVWDSCLGAAASERVLRSP